MLVLTSLLMLLPFAPLSGGARTLPSTSVAAPVVTVTATDYKLDFPSTLPAGPTTFVLVNHGRELHQMALIRLADGKTVADLIDAFRHGGPLPSWATEVGGPNGTDPGRRSLPTIVNLTAGNYAALCMIPSPDGVPHIMKGMVGSLTVTPSVRPVAAAAEPAPDVTITMADYGYTLSNSLTAGAHTMLVRNAGPQDHELELMRLAPGKSAADLEKWLEHMAGPPPASFLGGVTGLAKGRTNEMRVTLTPGHYALACFLPDAHDGKPHIMHGMVHEVVVR